MYGVEMLYVWEMDKSSSSEAANWLCVFTMEMEMELREMKSSIIFARTVRLKSIIQSVECSLKHYFLLSPR